MSAMAGIFCIDPQDRVGSESLEALAESIRFLGPDAGTSVCLSSVGLTHYSLHTTLESEREQQPLHIGSTWLTWDGRLDNRTELAMELDLRDHAQVSDATVVLTAYDHWGLGAFKKLEGDFAFCIWDEQARQLLLVRDPMGIKQLFLRCDRDRYVWCTALEPLVLQAGRALTLNLEHVHKLFSALPCLDSTCYEEIFAIPAGTVVLLRPCSSPVRKRYWSLPSGKVIRYRSEAEYEEHFRELLQRSVSRRLRANCPVTAELSGGLDSSTIVCVADAICTAEKTQPVETISYFNTDEPTGDERPYIEVIEQHRGKRGHHIAAADFHHRHRELYLQPLEHPFQASPGRFAHSLEWQTGIHDVQRRIGSRVVLSGVGGDEFLGAVPYGAPAVAEHLLAGRFRASVKSLLAWSISRQHTIVTGLKEVSELLRARRSPSLLTAHSKQALPWLLSQPYGDCVAIDQFADWTHLTPNQFSYEWLRCTLASQFTIQGTPLFGDTETRYPMLDRSLFAFLAGIPRDHICQPGKRRLLQRNALRGIVPDPILLRKTKWFGTRSAHETLRSVQAQQFFAGTWLTHGLVFDVRLLREAHADILAGNPGAALPLQMAIGFEQWLRIQVDRGTIALPALRSA